MSFLALPIVSMALFMVAAWASASLVYPIFTAALRRWPVLARGTLLVAALPVVLGVALALAAFLPGDPHLDQLLGCHCAVSMPGWLHLCPLHPTTEASVLGPALAAVLLLGPGRMRALDSLLQQPLGTGTGGAPTLVDLPRPIALLAGWLRPSLLIDRRLWSSLRPAHREAVLAHERAHLARRDPLVLAALRLLCSVAPRVAARRLMRRWLDHAERRADAAAACTVPPFTLAEALVICARMAPVKARALQLGWTGGDLDGRVRALLELRPEGRGARPDAGLADLGVLTLALGAGLACAPWLHHQVEHLINLAL